MSWFGKRDKPERDFREQKPRWEGRFQDRYDARVYWGGFEDSWPITVTDIETGVEIGVRGLPLDDYHSPFAHRLFKRIAEEVIRDHENWGPTANVKPIFEARPDPEQPWIWHVWDVEHPAECNHCIVATINSKGAAEDLHEDMARVATAAMNKRWARKAAEERKREMELV